jgi:hypothetical protein
MDLNTNSINFLIKGINTIAFSDYHQMLLNGERITQRHILAQLAAIVDELGKASALAQGLRSPITSLDRMRDNYVRLSEKQTLLDTKTVFID